MTVVLGPTWAYVQRDKLVTIQCSGLWDSISLQTLCWEIGDKSRLCNICSSTSAFCQNVWLIECRFGLTNFAEFSHTLLIFKYSGRYTVKYTFFLTKVGYVQTISSYCRGENWVVTRSNEPIRAPQTLSTVLVIIVLRYLMSHIYYIKHNINLLSLLL